LEVSGLCNVVQGGKGRRGRPDSGEAVGGDGRVSGGKWSRVRIGSIWALTCGGNGAGGRPRRRPAAAVAAGVTPTSWWLGLSNKRKGELLGILGQAGATRVGGASGRRVELAVGTTGGGNGGSVSRQCARRRA
jgi:hypothetical protein